MDNLNNTQILICAIFLFLLLIGWATIIFIIAARRKILNKEMEKIQLELHYQKELVSKIILAQEEERERISRDLHDEISSKLVAMHLNLYSLKSNKKSKEEKLNLVDHLIKINSNLTEQSRKLAHNLFPPVLEKFGLEAALQEIESEYNKSDLIRIKSCCSSEINQIGKNEQLQIFRIIKELITNSVKHGKASTISIRIEKQEDSYHFRYHDNGIGFFMRENSPNKGMGQINIESRLKILNAVHQIISKPNEGFLMTFKFKA